jgi:hypothetical protein
MKSTMRVLIIPVLLVLFSLSVLGQGPGRHDQKREKYRTMKIAYFTDNLELTPEEAERFWPLYNEFEKQKREFMRKMRQMSKEFTQQSADLSEEEAEDIIDGHMKARQQQWDRDLKFHQDLQNILPAKKVMNFYITEVQFREYMLKKIREDHANDKRRHGKQDP